MDEDKIKSALSVPMRTEGDFGKRNYGKWHSDNFLLEEEWGGPNKEWANRDEEEGWEHRYQYESSIISEIISQTDTKNVLEIGSGPGKLSDYIQLKLKDVFKIKLNEYHLVDKKNAEQKFHQRGYKGKFFVKDLFNYFDSYGLMPEYDMIIANDFLEHVANPSDVVNKCWNLCHENSIFFVSVPNWRMEHNFIYRGLFDFDNFKYFMWLHGFTPVLLKGSDLKTPKHEKIDSETTLPEELIDSWNWYFAFRKITEEKSEEMMKNYEK